jgi:hypothetical protein
MISAAKPAKARIQLTERASAPVGHQRLQRSAARLHRHLLGGQLARGAVGLEERLERPHRAAGHRLQRGVDDVGDTGEAQPALQERVDGDLVGRVEDARRGAAGQRRRAAQAQAREGLVVDGLEGQPADLGEVQAPGRQRHDLGVVQGVGDRDAHVGQTEVRELRAVGCLDQRVDDRLRVHHDVDALVGHAEQVVGLHDLKALVHQRRRVDGDLAAHRPRRVVERLLDGHARQLGACAPAEGSARGGDRDPLQRAGRHAVQQVVDGRVLGVDGQQPRTGGLGQLGDELATDDQRLLVGQREVDALPQRRDGRAQAGRPDERVEHEVGAGLQHELHKALGADEHLAVGPRLGRAGGGIRIAQRDAAHAVADGLLDKGLPGAGGAQADDLEVVGARDHVERLGADRPGGSEHEEAAGHVRKKGSRGHLKGSSRFGRGRRRAARGPVISAPVYAPPGFSVTLIGLKSLPAVSTPSALSASSAFWA